LFSHRSPILDGRTMGEQWENDGRNTLEDSYWVAVVQTEKNYFIVFINKITIFVDCFSCCVHPQQTKT
ncbi:MAG: hypothetical protein ACSW8I_03205, partial [bacterium]